jgi:hypothetical protein
MKNKLTKDPSSRLIIGILFVFIILIRALFAAPFNISYVLGLS